MQAVRPTAAVILPTAQLEHTVEPVSSSNSPAGHHSHFCMPSYAAYLPLTQMVHVLAPVAALK